MTKLHLQKTVLRDDINCDRVPLVCCVYLGVDRELELRTSELVVGTFL